MSETEPKDQRPAQTQDGKPIVYILLENSGVHINSPLLNLDFSLPEPCYRADTVKSSIEHQAGQPLEFVEENHSRNHK